MKNKGKLFSFKYLMQDFVRITGAIPLLLAYRPKRLYISKAAKKKIKGGALLASNHIGYFDSMCLMGAVWYRRHHFVASTELFERRITKFWFSKVCLCLPIEKDKPDMVNIKNIISHVNAGELVTVFPEGHVNQDDNAESISKFKSGIALMAIMSGKPIVPIYIQKRKSVFRRLRVAIGEPIYVDQEAHKKAPLAYARQLAEELYQRELELKELCERRKK